MSVPAPSARDVHRRVVELYVTDPQEGLKLIHKDVVDHSRRGWMATTSASRHGALNGKLPRQHGGGITVRIAHNISEGEYSTNRYVMRGTGPDGKPFEITGLDMVRVVKGQIIEHWALMDVVALQSIMAQPQKKAQEEEKKVSQTISSQTHP